MCIQVYLQEEDDNSEKTVAERFLHNLWIVGSSKDYSDCYYVMNMHKLTDGFVPVYDEASTIRITIISCE